MTPSARIAHFLLALAVQNATGSAIDLPMPRNIMADYLGMSVEMVCRILSLLAEAKVISIPNVSQVGIVDLRTLEKIAGQDDGSA